MIEYDVTADFFVTDLLRSSNRSETPVMDQRMVTTVEYEIQKLGPWKLIFLQRGISLPPPLPYYTLNRLTPNRGATNGLEGAFLAAHYAIV